MEQISLALRGGLGPISLPGSKVLGSGRDGLRYGLALQCSWSEAPAMNLGRSADKTQTEHSSSGLRQLTKVGRTSHSRHRSPARDPKRTLMLQRGAPRVLRLIHRRQHPYSSPRCPGQPSDRATPSATRDCKTACTSPATVHGKLRAAKARACKSSRVTAISPQQDVQRVDAGVFSRRAIGHGKRPNHDHGRWECRCWRDRRGSFARASGGASQPPVVSGRLGRRSRRARTGRLRDIRWYERRRGGEALRAGAR